MISIANLNHKMNLLITIKIKLIHIEIKQLFYL